MFFSSKKENAKLTARHCELLSVKLTFKLSKECNYESGWDNCNTEATVIMSVIK